MRQAANVVYLARPRQVHPALLRGYRILYHHDETNRCPGCGRSHWYVGRQSAECAFCATVLPLAPLTFTPEQRNIDA